MSEATGLAPDRPVIFVADRLSPRLGMERALQDLVQELSAHAQVIAISGDSEQTTGDAVAVTYLGLAAGWKGRLSAVKPLRGLVRNSDPRSTLVAVGIWAFIPLALATLLSPRRRIVLWEHSLLPWRLRHEPRVLVAATILRLLSFRCSQVISVSESSKRCSRALVWPFAASTCIPNVTPQPDPESVEESRTRRGDSDILTSLLGVGTLNRRKNWALAVRAMTHLPATVHLSIAGDGPDRAALDKLIRELHLEQRVRLLGYVSDVDERLKRADVLVHPSYAETFGYVLVEAAAARVPVASLSMPVMNEMIPVLVAGTTSTGDARALAAAIESAWTLPPEAFDSAQRTRERELATARVLSEWRAAINRDLQATGIE